MKFLDFKKSRVRLSEKTGKGSPGGAYFEQHSKHFDFLKASLAVNVWFQNYFDEKVVVERENEKEELMEVKEGPAKALPSQDNFGYSDSFFKFKTE